MKKEKWIEKVKYIITKDEISYEEVLNDFPKSKEIHILTFNISANQDKLLNKLNELDPSIVVTIITNIPQRYEIYHGKSARERAYKNIQIYMRKLLPSNFNSQVIPFFNFSNHAKILVTDNLAYVGSANFSEESKKNYESGFLIYDKTYIKFLRSDVFPMIISDSEAYFGDAFIEAKLFTLNLFSRLDNTYEHLFNGGFYYYIDEDYGIKPQFIYETRAYDFYLGSNDLENLEIITYEIEEMNSRLENLYDEIEEDSPIFKEIEKLESIIDVKKLEQVRDLISRDSNIYNMCVFDPQDYCDDFLEEHAMVAFDERLDYYAELAGQEAYEKFEELAENAQSDVEELKSLICTLKHDLLHLSSELNSISLENERIDNTI